MFGIHWRRSHVFFLCCIPTNLWYELLPGLASVRKLTFGCTVSRKWTRQLRHLDSINSSLRLSWGLFRYSITYIASLWRCNTTDTRTLHRINNVCCAVARGRKILPECKLFMIFRDVYLRLSQNIDPLLNLLGKMNLQTPCWKNWNSFDRYAGCFNFSFSSGCYETVHKLTKVFWNTFRDLPFFFCVQIKGRQSF